jgi:hypothetical protein
LQNSQLKCAIVPGSGTNQCQIVEECSACDPHGDINKDGSINIVDCSILMYYWNQTECSITNNYCHCADLNKDGKVDLQDFSIMLYYWTD